MVKNAPKEATKGHGLESTIWNGCNWLRLVVIFKGALIILIIIKFQL